MPEQRQQTQARWRLPRAPSGGRAPRHHRACLEAILVGEQELGHIGRELHDGICQELSGIAFQVQSLRTKTRSGGAVVEADLAHVVGLLQEATRHARGLSHGLCPIAAGPDGLAMALRKLAANSSDLDGPKCRFESGESVHLTDPCQATHLYRIAQEAVRDAIHQRQARRIRIELSASGRAITLRIMDDGRRLEARGRGPAAKAMQLMRHRAHLIGAHLSVRSGSSSGVSVICRLRAVA